MGRSILIASGKGGSGRTSFAVCLADILALRGHKVVLVNLNFGLRCPDIYMGLQDQVIFDIGDIMSGICRLDKALVRDDRFGELYLLESTQNKLIAGITEGHIKALSKQLKEMFDYVIIDGPAGIGDGLALAACGADSAIIMVTPDLVSVRSSDAVDKRLQSVGVKSRCYVVNMVRSETFSSGVIPGIEEINKSFSIPMAGIIPYDDNIHLANNSGIPVVLAQDLYIGANIDEIVTRMLG